jgi:hypothetical protein
MYTCALFLIVKAHLYHVHIHIENARTHSLKIYDAKNFQKQRIEGRAAACEGGTAQGLLEDVKWLPVLADLVRKPALTGDGVTVAAVLEALCHSS